MRRRLARGLGCTVLRSRPPSTIEWDHLSVEPAGLLCCTVQYQPKCARVHPPSPDPTRLRALAPTPHPQLPNSRTEGCIPANLISFRGASVKEAGGQASISSAPSDIAPISPSARLPPPIRGGGCLGGRQKDPLPASPHPNKVLGARGAAHREFGACSLAFLDPATQRCPPDLSMHRRINLFLKKRMVFGSCLASELRFTKGRHELELASLRPKAQADSRRLISILKSRPSQGSSLQQNI